MSKKFFISQPMNGLSDEQVLQKRAAVIGKAKAVFGDDAVCHNGQRIQQAWEDDEEG